MADSTDIQICNALRDLIHAAHPTWTVKRVHLPSWEGEKDLRIPRIELNPGSLPKEQDSTDYDDVAVEWPIMVNFAATIPEADGQTGNADRIDSLLDQAEVIRKFVQTQHLDLPNEAAVECHGFEYMTRMDPGLFDRQGDTYVGTFLSVLVFQFREVT